MSVPDSTLGSWPRYTVQVRPARTSDHAAIRTVVTAAYHEVFHGLPRSMLSRYLAAVLNPDPHGELMVAEVGGVIRGTAAFHPQMKVDCVGWPKDWAGGRGLVVHPDARRHGVAQALLTAGESRASRAGAAAFGFHIPSFMPGAGALYRLLGYSRSLEHDYDLALCLGVAATLPITAHAYRRALVAEPLSA